MSRLLVLLSMFFVSLTAIAQTNSAEGPDKVVYHLNSGL